MTRSACLFLWFARRFCAAVMLSCPSCVTYRATRCCTVSATLRGVLGVLNLGSAPIGRWYSGVIATRSRLVRRPVSSRVWIILWVTSDAADKVLLLPRVFVTSCTSSHKNRVHDKQNSGSG